MNTFDTLTAYIDNAATLSHMIDLQTRLTAIPALAPENGGDGEWEKARVLTQWLIENGFPEPERFEAPDERVSKGKRPNLIVSIPGKSTDHTVWIMSHLDIVPIGERSLWNSDPMTVIQEDGKIFGRGVEDNQQGLTAASFAALSFLKTGIQPAYTVKLLYVADEEVGSTYGIQYLLAEQQKGNIHLFNPQDIIVIPDGGDAKGETIEVAEKNLLWLKITTRGKQTHGSRPDEGANAFLANCDLAMQLHELETVFEKRDPLFDPPRSTFQPTKKEVNVPNINTIPGEDIFYMDCRILPCYTLNTTRAEVQKRIAIVEKKYGVSISFTEEQAVESPATAPDAPVVIQLSKAIKEVYGLTAHPIGIGGGTVGAYLRVAGFNACVWGKLNETAHQPNEYCILDNLIGDTKVLAKLMYGN